MSTIKKSDQTHWITHLALPALGVVFGDIGTSPLYTLRECLNASEGGADIAIVMGILSLMVVKTSGSVADRNAEEIACSTICECVSTEMLNRL